MAMRTVTRFDVRQVATTERQTDHLTAMALAGLVAVIAVPILIVTVAVVVHRPDGIGGRCLGRRRPQP